MYRKSSHEQYLLTKVRCTKVIGERDGSLPEVRVHRLNQWRVNLTVILTLCGGSSFNINLQTTGSFLTFDRLMFQISF